MELHTDRLILREFVPADWTAVLAYQRDPRYLRYYEWTDRTPEDVQRFVQMFIDQQAEQPRRKFQLAVTLKTIGQLVGNCGIRLASVDAHEADIGYELSSNHWGYGYATEAAHAIVQFGFAELPSIASGRGASPTTSPRLAYWKNSACSWKAVCAKKNTLKAAGGTR